MLLADFWTWFGTVGQWVAGIGSLSTLLYLVFKDCFKRPCLILSFDHDKDVRTQINTVGLDSPDRLSRWLRIRVRNKVGRRVAKNCRGFLIGIERIGEDGKRLNVFPNDSRQLEWTHMPAETLSLDLLPGVVHQLDVVGTVDGYTGVRVTARPSYALQEKGKYLLMVQVSAEDTEPQSITIPIEWNGQWDSLTAIPPEQVPLAT